MTRRLLRAPTVLYRHGAGWLLGHRFLQLTHHGRKSGRPYDTVLEVVHRDAQRDELVVVVGLGAGADWWRNLQAGGPAVVRVSRRSFPARHRRLPPAEAVAVLADYEHRNRWVTPVLRAALSRLVGWRYDGTDAARRRLAEQLPLVGLSPLPPAGAGAQE